MSVATPDRSRRFDRQPESEDDADHPVVCRRRPAGRHLRAAMMGQESPQDYPQWRGHAATVQPARSRNRIRGPTLSGSGGESKSERVTRRLLWLAIRSTPLPAATAKRGSTALDAETGETVWRTDYPVAYEAYEDAADHGDGPKATPLFHDGKLYTLRDQRDHLGLRCIQRKTRVAETCTTETTVSWHGVITDWGSRRRHCPS